MCDPLRNLIVTHSCCIYTKNLKHCFWPCWFPVIKSIIIHSYIEFSWISSYGVTLPFCLKKLYCFSRKIKSYALLLLFKNTVLFVCHRKPADLQNLAPGTHPPFITYNGEVKTDVNKIEEFLEDVLCPPK